MARAHTDVMGTKLGRPNGTKHKMLATTLTLGVGAGGGGGGLRI